jgi:hypothetical protein
MTDVRVPRRVREHLEAVELRFGPILGDFECAGLSPARLPLFFYFLGTILGHVETGRFHPLF